MAPSLVIVESPAKARTISKFLGRGYTIEASIGHIRDLPQGAKEMPEELQGRGLGLPGRRTSTRISTRSTSSPARRSSRCASSRTPLKDAKDLYLATDEDREGEAISWHLCEVLKPKVPVHRLVFHEITEEAIREALEQPRDDRPGAGPGPGSAADRRSACTATTCRRCCGGRSGRGFRPAACRAWPCG